jgi:RNA polymerase sigma factor (sigma-70 family)
MNSETHATLLDRIRDADDAVAWEEFWTRYWRAIFHFAKCQGCSEHTAEEVVQDVMLSVFEKRAVFRYDPAKGRFRDWLGGVVRNVVLKRRGKPAERVRAVGGEDDPAMHSVQETQISAEEAWERAFEETLLNVLLDVVRQEVHPATYQAFEFVVLQNGSAADAAMLTGLSRNAVYLAKKRVLERLQELGESYRDEGRLRERIRLAMAVAPSARAERTLTTWMAQSISARGELQR